MNRRYFRILHEISWTLLRVPTEFLNFFYMIMFQYLLFDPTMCCKIAHQKKRSLLQNLGAQKINLNIFYLIRQKIPAKLRIRKKRSFLQNLGAQKINLNIFYLMLFLPTKTCVFCSKHFCLRVKLVKET